MENKIMTTGMKQNQSNTIIHEDFLLQNEQAKILYHGYAKEMPIIDYHNHLPPAEIASNKKFDNLSQIWLKGDHYKWRAMRGLGVNEKFITGNTSDEEKFMAWATCFPETVRNPLFHWSQMELNFPFGINEYLNAASAKSIYGNCNDLLQQDGFSTQGILKQFNVKMVGTTDDPCDNLEHHQQIQQHNIGIKVLPSFRPDKAFNISNKDTFMLYLTKLEEATGIKIKQLSDLLNALENRLDYFHENGCRISDHGLLHMPLQFENTVELETEFMRFIENKNINVFTSPERFAGVVLLHLCKCYHKKGWVQQFHLGAIRNNNSRLLNSIGADAGVDSIGDYSQAQALSSFLDALDKSDELAKTILYNINPADNEMFATMCWNFNYGKTKGKIQYGSGWWFLDQKEGIEKQLNALSNMGTISSFVGMITDSRSFLSYSRHEYFRRILCNLLGDEMEKGLIPIDEKWIGELVKNICYNNAANYFDF